MQGKAAGARPAPPPVYRPLAVQAKPAAVQGGAKVVQRYTTYWKIKDWGGLGMPMRVSDDGKIAVPDSAIFYGTKTLYATADVIDAANQRLGAVRAPYELVRTADSIQGRKPWTMRTYQRLYRVIPRDTRNLIGGPGVKGGSGATLRTLENCSAHGLDSMGIGVDAGAQAGSTRDFRIDVGGGQTVRNSGSGAHPTDSDLIAKQRIMDAIHRDKFRLAAGAVVAADASRATYAALTTAERRRYARQFGMNEYAMPQPGDGIEALRSSNNNFAGFPMHFAAVVARSGNDYVTLENWAKLGHQRKAGDVTGASNDWYFRMYGIVKTGVLWDDDQSYSGEHAAEGSIADREHMLGLVNRNVAKV